MFKERVEALVSVATVDAGDDNEKNSAAWNEWVKAHLANERAEVIDIITQAMGQFASEYVHEKLTPLNRDISNLKGENAELRGMLGSVLAKFDALRASTDAAQQERIAEKRERQIRDQTIAERSARIADLQRENAASHAESRRQHLEQAFGQRDARLDLIETRLGMLLQFLSVAGVDFPRGGF